MKSCTERVEIRVHREPWLCDRIAVRVARVHSVDGVRTVAVADPLEFTVVDPDDLESEVDPAVRLRVEEAQQLMDELWRAGVRPTEGAGSAGQMAATEKHLEDMRRLVFSSNASDQLPPKTGVDPARDANDG